MFNISIIFSCRIIKFGVILFCLVGAGILNAQIRKIDSLRAIYFSSNHDSIKLQVLNELIWPLYSNSYPDSGVKYGLIAIEIAKKNNLDNKLIVSLRRLGICYTNLGNFTAGLRCHYQSLDLATKLKRDKDIGIALGNIGVVYMDIGDQTKALDYNLKSIRLKEKVKDYASIANNYYNIGVIYKDLEETDKAMAAMDSAVNISIRENQSNILGVAYNGIGMVFKAKKNYGSALNYYRKGIETNIKNENDFNLSESYADIGSLYAVLKQYDSAIYYFKLDGEISRKINYKTGMAHSLSNLSSLYVNLKEPIKVIKYAQASLDIDRLSLGNLEFCYGLLSDAYRDLGDYKKALQYYVQRNRVMDTLLKINKGKDIIRLQVQNDYDKKAVADSVKYLEQEKVSQARVEVADAKLQKEKIARYALIFGLIGLCVFSYFIYTRFKLIKKQNIIIDNHQKETQQQKILIEVKQKEILDSINYAKRIQYALLASDQLLKDNLQEHFVVFKPKDVVSGDFYWATPFENGFIFITADCTGHGVPGAFMSLLNISKLSQIINENKIVRPDLILNNIRSEIIKVLNPPGTSEESKDGMDAVLCKIDKKKMKLEFAAANNSFYIIRDKKIINCKADKMSVGKGYNDHLSFTYNEIEIKKGDVIYTFTDGYADQFGGQKGKKFKYKQLEETFLRFHQEPLIKQSEILALKFDEWKGELEQVDDVCILGVKI